MKETNRLILRHYSAEPFVFDPQRLYCQDQDYFKPTGLWLSVVGEDDWESWCQQENFHIQNLVHTTDFSLVTDANILHLDSPSGLSLFTRRYRRVLMPSVSYYVIDWPCVVKQYDGLIIAPYQWTCRLDPDMMWYYAWDCASGCIWNLKVIEKR